MLVPRMGDYLIQKGLIKIEDLQKALAYQQEEIAKGNTLLLGQVATGKCDDDSIVATQQNINQYNLKPPCYWVS